MLAISGRVESIECIGSREVDSGRTTCGPLLPRPVAGPGCLRHCQRRAFHSRIHHENLHRPVLSIGFLPSGQRGSRASAGDMFNWRPAKIYRQRDGARRCGERDSICEEIWDQAGHSKHRTRYPGQVGLWPSLLSVLMLISCQVNRLWQLAGVDQVYPERHWVSSKV